MCQPVLWTRIRIRELCGSGSVFGSFVDPSPDQYFKIYYITLDPDPMWANILYSG